MTIKAIMVDVDGVLIIHPDERGWQQHLERDLGVSAATLQQEFFDKHWYDVVHGGASLRERLAPVLYDLEVDVRCDDLIRYWFTNDAHVNDALLLELAAIRSRGTQVHLATVQEHERASFLWNDLRFRDHFDGLHYAAELGCSKPAAAFYRKVEERTGFQPPELILIDDRRANVEGAITCGWSAALWRAGCTLQSLLPNAIDRVNCRRSSVSRQYVGGASCARPREAIGAGIIGE
jgi:putative hydrolase of the HAD superfamily